MKRIQDCWLMLLTGLLAIASSAANPEFKLGPPQKKQLTMEYIYNYTTADYAPPVVVQFRTAEQASYTSPEDAFISQFSAMKRGDHDQWLKHWDAASQKTMAERDATEKRTADQWRTIWANNLKDVQVVLHSRIESGVYVLLSYSLHDPTTGKDTFRALFVSKQDHGQWVATQELTADPLLHQYFSGKDKVTEVVR